ncbi:RING finger protein 17 isoform X2 [Aricia agestis]|uniref:RING finger protein 17 isoform X2 n=1 Tax=Aricia agestis TaxID=91739 RepID=UPI001C208F97|nr:RING finger protein 17 isoform X2 [Aricia agestis]
MDVKIKKSCPNCSQFYQLKSLTAEQHGNIPLFLSCGHSMCENCVKNIVKFAEPIQCKVCHKDTEVSTADLSLLVENKIPLCQLFPVNFHMLGELTLEKIQEQAENEENRDKNFYIDVKSILENITKSEGMCMECHSPTSKMCQQCGIIVCNNCFTKSHKNFIIFKNHILTNIAIQDEVVCPTHIGKSLDYYCKTCEKPACMDCLMVGGEKSCKNHDVVSSQDVNQELMAEIQKLTPEVNEKLKRFTKTAVDIGNIMTNLDNNPSSEISRLSNEVEQNYSILLANVQKLKDDIIHKLEIIKTKKIKSLIDSKNEIFENIKKAKQTIDRINSLQENKLGQVNLSSILDQAKEIINEPWYLRYDSSDDLLKIKVNTELFDSLQNFMSLVEPEGLPTYELLTTDQLKEKQIEVPPPPQSVVYPPELVKDVRQVKKKVEKEKDKTSDKTGMLIKSAPKYHKSSKSGSCTSLNSITSDSSHNSSFTHTQKKSNNYNKTNYNNNIQSGPFMQPCQMKPLQPGDQDIVYITHIVDPHNFFVQRACHQSLVEELLREFRNASTMPKPVLNHVTEGKIYLVYIKADNLWQRCRILSVDRKDPNKPIVQVFCFDFGSIENVSIDKLRLIPSFRLQNPPPLAINCSLESIQPITGSWTSDDALLIQNIIDKSVNPHSSAVRIIRNSKQAVLTARAGAVSGRVACELSTFEHGVSVAHALVFHGRARLTTDAQYPKILGIKDKPMIFESNNTFHPNSKEEVVITHVVSPDKFFVRKGHLENVYEKLCNDLIQEYNINDNKGMIYLPEKDLVCAVSVEGGGWERARVLELPGRARVRVQLVDTGRVTLVHWTAMRRLPDKRCTLRALATECHLAGVTPLNQKWSEGSVLVLRALEGRTLTAHVEAGRGRAGGSVGVTLYDEQDPDDVVCVNKLMILRKYAVSFGINMFNTESEVEELVRTNKPTLQQPKPTAVKEKKLQILKRNTPHFDEPDNDKDLEAKNKGPYRVEVKILNYQSPSRFYVALISQQKVFAELYEKIQTYFTKKHTQPKDDWKVGDRCCTICNQSQTWRRAAILEIDGGTAKVFYSDFAVVEIVDLSSLREIPTELKSCGDAAIECHLSGVIPAVGAEWPSLTKEYLKELLDAYPRIFMTKNGVFKDKSIPVELWVYHTTQGGALEPNVSEWRCLNKKIIEQGLGIPDKTQELSTNASEGTNEETISFLNLTGSLEDWLQIEPMPFRPLKAESDKASGTDSSTPTELDSNKDYSQDSNTIFISDWLPAEPLPNEEFYGVPTNVDHDGIIYLHDVAQEETLDLIRKALDVRFKHPDPKAKFVKWTVGEPCIALYYLDNKFYRGRVLEVNEAAATCLIHYIDYGNEEICPFVNIRKSIALYQIPIQAHRCVLGRIRPVAKHWDRQTLDYIHKSIVEKQCSIEVLGEPIDGVAPINLKYDKLCINEHLVDFEMAEFTDGTKAKVQKFIPSAKSNKIMNMSFGTSDSGPDYIVEHDDETPDSPASFDMEQFANKNWNDIVDEEAKTFDGRFVSYPQTDLTEFTCEINIINDTEQLELSIVHDDGTKELYETMFEEIQHDNSLPIDGIFENKACLALFAEDKQWYRALILQYSETKGKVKVKYIDYGNIAIISVADVREIDEEYTKLPPATVAATLHGVKINPDIPKETILDCYSKKFLEQGPFKAIVIDNKTIPEVLLQDEDGKLVYEDFFGNIFIKID